MLPDGVRITLKDLIWGGGGHADLPRDPEAFFQRPGAPCGYAQAVCLATIHAVELGDVPTRGINAPTTRE